MGLMFIALGFGSVVAALMLFVFQTFYKGLVFMNAGAIMKANRDEDDIRKIAGPRALGVLVPTIVGVASLAGIFPLSGFFGKVAVESVVQSYAVYALLLATELVSSMYIFRWLFTPLSKDKAKVKADYRMPASMTAAAYVLVLAILASSAAWVYYAYAGHPVPLPPLSYQEGAAYTAVVAAGLLLSYVFYYRRVLPNPRIRASLSRIADASVEVNACYRLVGSFVNGLGSAVDGIDHGLYAIVRGSGYGLGRISTALGGSEGGSINYYLAAFVIGAIVAIVALSVI
jgi:NADH-quinone oxidoreductase subunit L